MTPDQRNWRNQCEAAGRIKEQFGTRKALGYLVGEKFHHWVQASVADAALALDLPEYARDVQSIFEESELRDYLGSIRRLGALAHVVTDLQFEELRDAGAVHEDVVTAAEDVLRIERLKSLLLIAR